MAAVTATGSPPPLVTLSTELVPPDSAAAPFAPAETKSELNSEQAAQPSTPTTAPLSLPESHPTRTSSIPGIEATPSSTLQPPATPFTPSSPARRRPKPPTKGILKPPPPPPKPTLGNRLRDLAANVVGGQSSGTSSGRGFFESDDAGNSAGPSGLGSPSIGSPGSVSAAVGGTLNALSGKIGLGLSRLVNATSPVATPNGSPMSRNIGLPDVSTPPSGLPIFNGPSSEKAVVRRQKGPLRRATFVLPSLSITYPISSQGEPWSAKVIEDRKRIESSHKTLMSVTTGAEYWTAARLVKLYETACKGREEVPRPGIVQALQNLPPHPKPRHLHLALQHDLPPSNPNSEPVQPDQPLNRHAAEALADVLSSEWGLSEVKLEAGLINDDLGLKPILHALLVSGTLPSLSLAGNKRLRERAWRLLAIFLKKARSLKYVDLSDTTWDRRSIDYLVQALTATAIRSPVIESPPIATSAKLGLPTNNDEEDDSNPPPDSYGSFVPHAPLLKDEEEMRAAGLQTLRMDGCQLRASLLEPLASGIRTSDIRNLSLRRNKIGPIGAVALALMIRDYPDSSSSTMTAFNSSSISLNSDNSNSNAPYTPRTRRTADSSSPSLTSMLNDNLPPLPPSAVSTPSRPPPMPSKSPFGSTLGISHPDTPLSTTLASAEGRISGPDTGGASVALQRQVRSLDGVERIGRLLTLDLKGNEIKGGVNYIAQVLKRNRTLKVLNLSDNRIEPAGLLALAEALKYNSTLETLDLSSNPCCGPSLEGITALRTAFTVNTSLKRLFLSETNLHPEGAIALAEFLPESHSLLHLDLTSNPLDVAGILALSSGLKSNTTIRCLDLSIPPNNPDLADLSQGILLTCIRNTELAAESTGRGGEAVWGPIKKSVLVRQVKEAETFRAEQERLDVMSSPEGLAREYVYKLTPERLVGVCENTGRDMERWLVAGQIAKSPHFQAWEPGQLPREDWRVLFERAKALRERLADEIPRTGDDEALARMLELNDSLGGVLETAAQRRFVPPPRLLLPSQMVNLPPPPSAIPIPNGSKTLTPNHPSPMSARHRRHMRTTSLEISSPNFSIGDSDNDSDAEELDVGRLPSTPQPPRPNSPGKRLMSDLRLEAEDEAEEALGEAIASPVERVGKAWMEEEGEVFRKGTRLGVAADDEEVDEGVSGEVLRQEILETEVARSPARRVVEDVDDNDNAEDEREREGNEDGVKGKR